MLYTLSFKLADIKNTFHGPHHKHIGVNYELSLYVMNSFISFGRQLFAIVWIILHTPFICLG